MALDKGSSKKERLKNAAFEKKQENFFSDASIVDKVIAKRDGIGRYVIKGEDFLEKSKEKISCSFGQIDKHAAVRKAFAEAATNASPETIKELGIDKYL